MLLLNVIILCLLSASFALFAGAWKPEVADTTTGIDCCRHAFACQLGADGDGNCGLAAWLTV